jgi:negative regulator of sigma-B (phosphoserine phosphatase)
VRVAVMDGLGHGQDAHAASTLAIETLASGLDVGVEAAFAALDRALSHSRGAALSLADIDLEAGRMRWAGVGNVEGVLVRGQDPQRLRERLLQHSGIVGYRLPRPPVRELALNAGDRLIFCTDGIQTRFMEDLDWRLNPQACADAILKKNAKETDDALVWTGSFHG